jgi:uncharacterized membrane protein
VRRDTKIAGAVLPVIPVAVLASVMVATRAIASGASERWRLLFRPLCHGIAERCLTVWGAVMPICARCTALYLGLLAGLLVFWMLPRTRETTARRVMFAAALPMAIDGLSQATGLRTSTNELRIITGLLAGSAFGWWVLTAIEDVPSRAAGRLDAP